MKIETLQLMLCRQGFTPDEALCIIRSDFKKALELYHKAKKYNSCSKCGGPLNERINKYPNPVCTFCKRERKRIAASDTEKIRQRLNK